MLSDTIRGNIYLGLKFHDLEYFKNYKYYNYYHFKNVDSLRCCIFNNKKDQNNTSTIVCLLKIVNKDKSEYEYKDGKQIGKATTWYENGTLKSETEYVDGKKNGRRSTFHENGTKEFEWEYKDGLKNGKYTAWDENNIKVSEKEYKEGVVIKDFLEPTK